MWFFQVNNGIVEDYYSCDSCGPESKGGEQQSGARVAGKSATGSGSGNQDGGHGSTRT